MPSVSSKNTKSFSSNWLPVVFSAISSYLTNKHNSKLSHKANKFNAMEAQLNREFQERMSNTAVSRYRDDLVSAGFNPLLAASGGSQASTPGSTPATGGYSQSDNPLSTYFENATAARNLERMQAEISQISASARLARVQAGLVDSQRRSQDINSALALERHQYRTPEYQTRSNLGSVTTDISELLKQLTDFSREKIVTPALKWRPKPKPKPKPQPAPNPQPGFFEQLRRLSEKHRRSSR